MFDHIVGKTNNYQPVSCCFLVALVVVHLWPTYDTQNTNEEHDSHKTNAKWFHHFLTDLKNSWTTGPIVMEDPSFHHHFTANVITYKYCPKFTCDDDRQGIFDSLQTGSVVWFVVLCLMADIEGYTYNIRVVGIVEL